MPWYPRKHTHEPKTPHKVVHGFIKPWRYSEQLSRCVKERNATPKWITSAHRQDMLAIYKYARKLTKETGTLFTVDHIEPLTNKNFSGLHVPWNLRVITGLENNLKKNNRIENYISPWCVFPTPIK